MTILKNCTLTSKLSQSGKKIINFVSADLFFDYLITTSSFNKKHSWFDKIQDSVFLEQAQNPQSMRGGNSSSLYNSLNSDQSIIVHWPYSYFSIQLKITFPSAILTQQFSTCVLVNF